MRLDKFTTKFQQALSDAQSLAVGGDQQIGGKALRAVCAKFTQAARAGLFAHLDQVLGVKAQAAPGFNHSAQGFHVDAVLALVVGNAASVPATVLFGEIPGAGAFFPFLVKPANDIAVAVAKNRGQMAALNALGEEKGRQCFRVCHQFAGKAHRLEGGSHFLFEIGL